MEAAHRQDRSGDIPIDGALPISTGSQLDAGPLRRSPERVTLKSNVRAKLAEVRNDDQ